MELNLDPVKVEIFIEDSEKIEGSAFNTVCFFYKELSRETPDELITYSLKTVVENGFPYASKAYNFCKGVFAQNKGVRVVLRKVLSGETYEEAYKRLENYNYYFVVLEDKDLETNLEFQEVVDSDVKLLFFSSDKDVSNEILGKKIVCYYQPSFDDFLLYDTRDIVLTDSESALALSSATPYSQLDDIAYWKMGDDIIDWDNSDRVLLEYQDIKKSEADEIPLAYPEGAWIGRCGYTFPSRVQWLFKDLDGVDPFFMKEIPDLTTTSSVIRKNKVTVGSGLTGEGIPINLQVSLDWLKNSLENNCWNLLLTSEKVNATKAGLDMFEQRVKEVLDVSVQQYLFSSYKITERNLDRKNNKVSFKFTANLLHTILGVDKVEGYIYQ